MKNLIHQGFEKYLIDKNGNIFNTVSKNKWGKFTKKTPRLVKSYPNKKTGYHLVVLQNKETNAKPKAFYIHRLVAECYLPNPFNLPEVNHKDFDKSNNSVENLEWVTKKQNKWHTINNKNFDGGKLYNSIINNKELFEKGIEEYKRIGRLDAIACIWDCSVTTAKKILLENEIEIYKKNLIPIYIKNELIEAYNLNKHWKPRHLKEYTLTKYNLQISSHIAYSIIKNRKSFFTKTNSFEKTEKNIIQKTVFDFANDIY